MKQYWQRLSLKIDALSLRERAIIFGMVALMVVVMVNTFLLDPQFAKQKKLSAKLNEEQALMLGMQIQIQQKMTAQRADPDSANRKRLATLKEQSQQLQSSLRDMQKGLVSPDKMPMLLEDILTQNGRLRLVSLRTLPATNLNELIQPDSKTAAEKTPVGVSTTKEAVVNDLVTGMVYRHSVEIAVQGEYLDMLNYLVLLEAMPWQLFWGKASLNVDEYPKSTLTLTLFTLSLDKKWMNL